MSKENRKEQREEAFKTLYSMEIRDEFSKSLAYDFIDDNGFSNSNYKYYLTIVATFVEHKDEIDGMIDENMSDFRGARLSAIDLSIIRVALTEIFQMNTNDSIAINEAVLLSKRFSATDQYKVINAFLGDIVRKHAWV